MSEAFREYASVTEEFSRRQKESLSYDDLKSCDFVKDLEIRMDHLPTVFCIDGDGDGLFSEDDVYGFLKWQSEQRKPFLPHEWPPRSSALCALRFAADVSRSAAWLSRLPLSTRTALSGLSSSPAETEIFVAEYAKLVNALVDSFACVTMYIYTCNQSYWALQLQKEIFHLVFGCIA